MNPRDWWKRRKQRQTMNRAILAGDWEQAYDLACQVGTAYEQKKCRERLLDELIAEQQEDWYDSEHYLC